MYSKYFMFLYSVRLLSQQLISLAYSFTDAGRLKGYYQCRIGADQTDHRISWLVFNSHWESSVLIQSRFISISIVVQNLISVLGTFLKAQHILLLPTPMQLIQVCVHTYKQEWNVETWGMWGKEFAGCVELCAFSTTVGTWLIAVESRCGLLASKISKKWHCPLIWKQLFTIFYDALAFKYWNIPTVRVHLVYSN